MYERILEWEGLTNVGHWICWGSLITMFIYFFRKDMKAIHNKVIEEEQKINQIKEETDNDRTSHSSTGGSYPGS